MYLLHRSSQKNMSRDLYTTLTGEREKDTFRKTNDLLEIVEERALMENQRLRKDKRALQE